MDEVLIEWSPFWRAALQETEARLSSRAKGGDAAIGWRAKRRHQALQIDTANIEAKRFSTKSSGSSPKEIPSQRSNAQLKRRETAPVASGPFGKARAEGKRSGDCSDSEFPFRRTN